MSEQRVPATPVSVVVVSWCRPEFVRSCLDHLGRVEPSPSEVFVVDASPDDLTEVVVDKFSVAQHVRFPGGAGHMTTSRNIGLTHVTGEIIAFIDDDAYVREGWMKGLLEAFADPAVGGVAGRTCNGHAGEESEGVNAIGRLLADGRLTGNFAADPGEVIEVEHGIGANMAFRRHALSQLGGFRDDFRGVGGVREDTDMFLRLRALGYKVVFSPAAVVDHVGAPHVKGRRFDYRYSFWTRHNHALLLARNYGLGSRRFRRWLLDEVHRASNVSHVKPLRRVARGAIGVAGVAAGAASGLCKARWNSSDPVRRDAVGVRLRDYLRDPTPSPNSH